MRKRIPKIVLAHEPSDRRKHAPYEIRFGRDYRVYCTCPDWKFNPKGPGNKRGCKHLERFRQRILNGRTRLDVRVHA